MKIIYVPETIRAALAGANNQPGLFTNLDSLANTLSAEDVALYIYCNMAMATLVPLVIVESFDLVPFEAQLEGAPATSDFAKTVKDFLLSYKTHQPNLMDRFGKGLLVSDLLDEDTVRFTHYENKSTSEDDTLTLYERVIQQMYSFIPFEKLSALPVMAGFLASLQKKVA